MTSSEIIEELKIIIIGLGSFFRAYIIPFIAFVYVTGEYVIESVKDQTKASDNWQSFRQFWQEQSSGWFADE